MHNATELLDNVHVKAILLDGIVNVVSLDLATFNWTVLPAHAMPPDLSASIVIRKQVSVNASQALLDRFVTIAQSIILDLANMDVCLADAMKTDLCRQAVMQSPANVFVWMDFRVAIALSVCRVMCPRRKDVSTVTTASV